MEITRTKLFFQVTTAARGTKQKSFVNRMKEVT